MAVFLSCLPSSTLLPSPRKPSFNSVFHYGKGKIHGIYHTENQEEYKQYYKLFLHMQMFDLLASLNFNFVAT